MSIQTLLPQDILYVYSILQTYVAKTDRALEKHKKNNPDNYEKDPQYIFDLSEKKRMSNIILKLFTLRTQLKELHDEPLNKEAEKTLQQNAGTKPAKQ